MPYSLLFQLFCYMLAQPHYPSLALVSYLKPLCFFYASPTPSAWGHPSQQCPFSHRGFPGIYPELTSYLRGPPGKPCWPLHTAESLLPDLPASWVPSPRTFTLYWNFTLHERPSSPMGSQHFLLLSSISKGHISSIYFELHFLSSVLFPIGAIPAMLQSHRRRSLDFVHTPKLPLTPHPSLAPSTSLGAFHWCIRRCLPKLPPLPHSNIQSTCTIKLWRSTRT